MGLLNNPNYQMKQPVFKLDSSNKQMNHFCPVCHKGRATDLDSGLLAHMLTHIRELHQGKKNCERCQAYFDTSEEYLKHLYGCKLRKPCKHCQNSILHYNRGAVHKNSCPMRLRKPTKKKTKVQCP